MRRLFAVTKGERHHALFVTQITTGMRHGEVQALRWQDINFERRSLSVCRTLHHEPGKGWVPGPTKTRKSRQVALPAETVAALKAHKARQAEMRLLAGPEWQDTGLIFTTERGTALHRCTIQDAFDRACERAGISRRKVNETRHTFATLGLVERVPVKIVSEALGHASVAITYDIYSHVIVGLQEDSMVHLDRLFS